jgi:hypothetical protein
MGRFCSCKHFCSSEPILDELGTSRLSVYHIGGKVLFAAFTLHGVEDFESRRSLSLSYVPLSNTRLYLASFTPGSACTHWRHVFSVSKLSLIFIVNNLHTPPSKSCAIEAILVGTVFFFLSVFFKIPPYRDCTV